jgi:hypothetical protein
MFKLESIKRHILIIEKLRPLKRATFAKIVDYLAKESNWMAITISMYQNARFNDLDDIVTI